MTEATRPAKKAPMREVLAEAAFQLFLDRGFEQTTVDDIVARAGVGRRSFFRYFPSKEDAVFPDHERCLADMTAFLEEADGTDPVGTVSDAARLVLRMYAANPEFSVQRYRLTREVPGLRTYELSVVRRYERTLAGYLRERFEGERDGALRAEVIAASVVAAHNNGLRSWLRSGGEGDPYAAVDHALGMVRGVWSGADQGAAPRAAEDEVVVMVAPKGAPMWQVVQRIEAALGQG
ncbi:MULTISPECIES: TetR family transcriptional regulator [unclassified Streptomyces]|uniref:TetR family transcriptional regulator n=1 Tax=unclassified Streptomyces TaxID=2593676 RepID=UPI002258894A|nr:MULTISPECIES: TetR family transcriptional regulator [unclassified Streptomyces]MCX5435720.1 TetR/AcrR family transcriptional regulator [Streptomyces sp. NBC_00063]WSE13529.1 TetR/AcrR family transcriptional regulator [Streptomyces sp. NBC_01397]WUB97553.1 TetR/AcrR family transcriptional regulator [Streptomyces sp. NBC_00569]